MIAEDRRHLLFPVVGFLVLLGAGFVVSGAASSRPEADLYRRCRTYLENVGRGDLDAALAAHAGLVTPEEVLRVRDRSGWMGQITSVTVSGEGGGGEVLVVWVDGRGRAGGLERLLWEREPGRGWRLVRVADSPSADRRFQ